MTRYFIGANKLTQAQRDRIYEDYHIIKDDESGIIYCERDEHKPLSEGLKENSLKEMNDSF